MTVILIGCKIYGIKCKGIFSCFVIIVIQKVNMKVTRKKDLFCSLDII